MPTFTISTQHSTESPSQYKCTRKVSKSYPSWKEKVKLSIHRPHDPLLYHIYEYGEVQWHSIKMLFWYNKNQTCDMKYVRTCSQITHNPDSSSDNQMAMKQEKE